MNIRSVKYDHLTTEEIAAWSAIQRRYPEFRSPFFRPEFTQLVDSVRDDIEVAVLDEGGTPVGFLPFQRSWLNSSWPVCKGLSEYHGLIAAPETEWDVRAMLRGCGLSSWHFDHLTSAHASFNKFAWLWEDSPYIDISTGFDSYIDARPNRNSLLQEYRQKSRKLEREFGTIRHVAHVSDPEVLAICNRWKGAHARRTGRVDILKNPDCWFVRLLFATLAYQSDDFASMMSVYYVGDEVASINFGMRSGDTYHSWMTSYNVQLGNRSPGILHWLDLLRAGESLGIRRVLLGKGEEEHKRRLMNGADRVGSGCLDLRPTIEVARRTWRRTRRTIKESPLRATAQVPLQLVRRISAWREFR